MLKSFIYEALNLIFPRFCLVCKSKLKDKDSHDLPMCSTCIRKIEPNLPPYCMKCGRSLPGRYDANIICAPCNNSHYYFSSARSPYIYEGVMGECIQSLKYRAMLQIMGLFERLLLKSLANSSLCTAKDIITPVPLHKTRLRERGFNQAELLASLIKQINHIKIHTGLLKRIKPTRPQTKLTRPQRTDNIKGAFEVILPSAVKEKDILLIDDVFTTGSTANECARVLIEAGAKRVDVWTLARTRQEA